MKKVLLVLCSMLILGNLSAQKSRLLNPNTKHQTETRKDAKKKASQKERERASADSLWKTAQKEVEMKVKSNLASRRATLLQESLEMVDTLLLDKVVIDGKEQRTYTYSKEGRRETEIHEIWENGAWVWNSQDRYEYLYDSYGRYTKRSIYSSYRKDGSDETETSRVEISYQNGNTYYKYYELRWYGETESLVLAYESGYDAQERSILSKQYDWDGSEIYLVNWNESKYNADGDEILSIYWNKGGDEAYGSKSETIVSGLTTEDNRYKWDNNTKDWKLEYQDITILDNKGNILKNSYLYYMENGEVSRSERTYEYNVAGRITNETNYDYEDDVIQSGWQEISTYDAYNRVETELYKEYENGEFVNSDRSKYVYWGTEANIDDKDEDFEGPLLTYESYQWINSKWELDEELKYTRDDAGIITAGTSMEKGEFEVAGSYIIVTETSIGIFDNQGRITSSTTKYEDENGVIRKEEKAEYAYDSAGRNTSYKSWVKDGNSWILDGEEISEYDSQGREILNSYREKYDSGNGNEWHGRKTVTVYDGNITKRTDYSINFTSGEFNTTPSGFYSEGTLSDGTNQTISYNYDNNGNVEYGSKEEWLIEGNKEIRAYWNWNKDTQDWTGRKTIEDRTPIKINTPGNPENYNDNVGGGIPVDLLIMTLQEYYDWINNAWFLRHGEKYERQSNGDLICSKQENYGGSETNTETIVYSHDSQGRVSKVTRNDTDITNYTYNSDGLLETVNSNGVLTSYYYSKHQYQLPNDINDITTDSSLKIDGLTVTAEDASTILRVYSMNGTLIATGMGSISVPESGIYIVTTPKVTLKTMLQ